MNDWEQGKAADEDRVMQHTREAWNRCLGRSLTEAWIGTAAKTAGSPDFIFGLNTKPLGVELTEVRGASDAPGWLEEASRLSRKKNESYSRRGLFSFPIILVFHSENPALFDMRSYLECHTEEFLNSEFLEIWAVDLSDAYFSTGHPLKPADLFCFKPISLFGFFRAGQQVRKPYG